MLSIVQAPGSKRKKNIYFKDTACNIPGLIFTKFKGLEGWPKGKVDCWLKKKTFNNLIPMSDQDRTSPYNINTISSRQVMRIIGKKILFRGLIFDPVPNSPN